MSYKLLIVEDDAELQELYATMLSGVNCQIVCAYDGGQAWEKLEEMTPDLIILDLLLDEVMGDEFYFRIKEESRYADIPIVIASVLSADRCQRLLEVDPGTVFLRKPFRREDLVDAVEKGLANRSKES